MKDSKFMQPLLPTFLTTFSIPESFSRKLELELKEQAVEKVFLTAEDEPGFEWGVEIEGGRHFKDGWNKFCIDNELKAGYFLVFTHINTLVFCVCVYDHVTSCERDCLSPNSYQYLQNSHTLTGSKRGRFELNVRSYTRKRRPQEAEAEAEVTTTQIPDVGLRNLKCHVTLTSYYIKQGIINLPKEFLKSSGLVRKRCEMTLIDGKGRSWQMNLIYKESNGQGYLTKGWKAFQAANSFKPNNVIDFQVIEAGKKPTFKCFRSKRSLLQLKVKSNTCKRKPQKADTEAEVASLATTQIQDVESPSLSCCVTLTSKYIKRHIAYLPMTFLKSSGLVNKCCKITLVDGEDRPWKMNLSSNKRSGQGYFTQGWKEFQAAKNLRPNNVVSFQVIKAGERPTLKALVNKVQRRTRVT